MTLIEAATNSAARWTSFAGEKGARGIPPLSAREKPRVLARKRMGSLNRPELASNPHLTHTPQNNVVDMLGNTTSCVTTSRLASAACSRLSSFVSVGRALRLHVNISISRLMGAPGRRKRIAPGCPGRRSKEGRCIS